MYLYSKRAAIGLFATLNYAWEKVQNLPRFIVYNPGGCGWVAGFEVRSGIGFEFNAASLFSYQSCVRDSREVSARQD